MIGKDIKLIKIKVKTQRDDDQNDLQKEDNIEMIHQVQIEVRQSLIYRQIN
jgi:hypothetical protein